MSSFAWTKRPALSKACSPLLHHGRDGGIEDNSDDTCQPATLKQPSTAGRVSYALATTPGLGMGLGLGQQPHNELDHNKNVVVLAGSSQKPHAASITGKYVIWSWRQMMQRKHWLALMAVLLLVLYVNSSQMREPKVVHYSHVPGMRGADNFDPYLPEVMTFFKREKYKPCATTMPLTRLFYNETTQRYVLHIERSAILAYSRSGIVDCCYQAIVRNSTGINADKDVTLGHCVTFKSGYELPTNVDNILVKCRDKDTQVYANGHAMMPRRQEIRDRLNTFSHNDISDCSSMDARMVEYLRRFDALGTFNNTVVVFFSDHGMRFGPTRRTVSGHVCYGCAKPFMMGAKCTVSSYCCKLGLHAHHPHNCLFYLRDKLPLQLQFLLKANGVAYDVDPVPAKAHNTAAATTSKPEARCPIQLQKETPGGLVDTVCSAEVPDNHAGLCRTHYVEYLTAQVAKAHLDPLPIFDLTDCVQELRRRCIALPERGPWDTDEIYKKMCSEVIKQNIPLESAVADLFNI